MFSYYSKKLGILFSRGSGMFNKETVVCKLLSGIGCGQITNKSLTTYLPQYQDFHQLENNDRYRLEKEKQQAILREEIKNHNFLNSQDMESLKNKLFSCGSFVNERNFDSIFLGTCAVECSLDAGMSYFRSVYSPGKCSIATIGKFFRLCYNCQDKCGIEEKKLISDLYDELLKRHSILDATTCENTALALSITERWKECLNLLEMCQETSPSSKMYSSVIVAAFNNGDNTLGWELMNEMIQNQRRPHVEVYQCWMRVSSFKEEALLKIFRYFEEYSFELIQEEAEAIINLFKNTYSKALHSTYSIINSRGKCNNCHSQLNPIVLTNEEFSKIRSVFLDPVLIGRDIFLKTKPAEFDGYLKFLKNAGKLDIVVDGLNVFYTGKKKNLKTMSHTLETVVRHFIERNKTVLVIGRQHLSKLPAMNYIKKNAQFFLTDDVSADDPFLLYATMYSGLNTYFLSRDQMRGHKFLLKDPQLRNIFSKWQQKYQYYLRYVANDGRVVIREPLPYQQRAQQSGGSGGWHIPMVTDTYNIPGHLKAGRCQWLCLSP